MGQVSLTLPEELVKAARLDDGNVSQETAKLIALELFREQKVSIGRAAELCGVPLAAFIDFAAAHDVTALNYGPAEAEEDRRTIQKLRR